MKERQGTSWLSDRSETAFSFLKVSVISSKGAFDIKELQVFQADLQINRTSECLDLNSQPAYLQVLQVPLIFK